MRRIHSLCVAAGFAALLALSPGGEPARAAEPTYYASHQLIETPVVIGGMRRELPEGEWRRNDACSVGVSGTTEYRCAFEFRPNNVDGISRIYSAALELRRIDGCPTNDCPIDLGYYQGSGSEDRLNVGLGPWLQSFTPALSSQRIEVLQVVQTGMAAGDPRFLGFALARGPGNNELQTFDSGPANPPRLVLDVVRDAVVVQLSVQGPGMLSSVFGDCPPTCTIVASADPESEFSFHAWPDAGAIFDRWDGYLCAGSERPTCGFMGVDDFFSFVAVFRPLKPGEAPVPTRGPVITDPPRPTGYVPDSPTALPTDALSAAPTRAATTPEGTSNGTPTPALPAVAQGASAPGAVALLAAVLLAAVGGFLLGNRFGGLRRRRAGPG